MRKLPNHHAHPDHADDAATTSFHLADVTMFWAAESGGVKRYLRAKHNFLRSTRWRHTLVVPGTADDASNEVAVVPGVPLPMSAGYRVPLRCGPAERALCALSPDLIEAGDQLGLSAKQCQVAALQLRQHCVPVVLHGVAARGMCQCHRIALLECT